MIATFPMRRIRMGQAEPQTEVLKTRGALLEVKLGIPASVAAGMTSRGTTVPAPKTVLALIDTGASISALSQDVADASGLIQTGMVQLGGIGGTGMRPVYAASIGFGDPKIPAVDPVQIAGVDLPSKDFHFLIGRDILRYLVMTYDGPRGVFALVPGGNAPEVPPGTTFVQPAEPLPVNLNVGEFPTWLVAASVGVALLSIFDVF